jgi:hypothetical protein
MHQTDGFLNPSKISALAQQQRPYRREPYASNEKTGRQNSQIQTEAQEHHGEEKGHEEARQKEVTPQINLATWPKPSWPSEPKPDLLLDRAEARSLIQQEEPLW